MISIYLIFVTILHSIGFVVIFLDFVARAGNTDFSNLARPIPIPMFISYVKGNGRKKIKDIDVEWHLYD